MRHELAGTPVRLRRGETVKLYRSACCANEIEVDKDLWPLPPCDGPRCADPDAATWRLVATAHG